MKSHILGVVISLLAWAVVEATTTTHHWKSTPERIPKDAEGTFDFWLENFTQPIGLIRIAAYFITGSKDILTTSTSGRCSTPTLSASEKALYSAVNSITCDVENARHSFRIKKLPSTMRLRAHVHDQYPQHSDLYTFPYEPPTSVQIAPIESEETVFTVGEKVGFKCDFRGGKNNRGYFSFHHLNSSIPLPREAVFTPAAPSEVKESNYGESVTIAWRSHRGHEGWYRCEAIYYPSSVGKFTSTPVYLNVVYAPVIDDTKDHTDHLEAETGQNVTFSIPILANPVATAVWTRHGKLLENNRFQVDAQQNDESGQEFILSFAVRGEDYGMYKCIVSNTQGQSTYYFSLGKSTKSPIIAEQSQWNATSTALIIITVLVLVMAAIGIAISVIFYRRQVKASAEPVVAYNGKRAEEPVYEDMSGGHM